MKFLPFLITSLLLSAQSVLAQSDTLSFARPEKLNDMVNSSAEESLPILSPDDQKLYFSRTYHPKNTGGKWAGQDIWHSSLSNGNYTTAVQLDGLNTKGSDVVVGTARGGKRLYLLNVPGEKKGTTRAGISRVEYDEALGRFGDRHTLPIQGLDVDGNFYSAFVGANEDYILWTLPGNGLDTTNSIYVSTSTDKGETWTAPELIADLASDLDDISPFYDEARNLLFWSSNGREGYGDYDIYYARRLGAGWQEWSEPVNAGDAINSTGFDAYFFAIADGTSWFCSNKGDTLSSIYLSSVIITPPADEVEQEEEPAEETVEDLSPAPKSDKLPVDPVLIIDTKDGSSRDKNLRDLSLAELLDKDTHIRFVYFPYDKYNITAKYIEVLDDVGKLLDLYPQLSVRIDGHTDNVGSQAYNMVLSENRALSTKEYLLIHGIEDGRIETRAFGKSEPYVSNDTDDGRALNRRVELYFRQAR